MNIRSFWHRGVNRIYTEAVQRWNEKEFTAQDGQTLRYMFFPCKKSDILVVGFQACNDAGPRYNQVRTLKECGVNRLLIKDDFGPRQLGVYYLGCKENHAVETAVFELIDRCIAESRTLFKYIVFSGSSKGGYAALNFGIHYPNSVMVVAAPQYFFRKLSGQRKVPSYVGRNSGWTGYGEKQKCAESSTETAHSGRYSGKNAARIYSLLR